MRESYPDYCDCHMKHAKMMDGFEKDLEDNSTNHRELWNEVKKKMPSSWLYLLVPIIMSWVGFQLAIYDSVKNVETKVAVIQIEINKYIKSSNQRMGE